MSKYGLNIKRTKIEAMANNVGVPESAIGEHYFEFHFKVNSSSKKDWDKLAETIVGYGAHLFFNTYSQTGRMQPVVTLRCYDTTYKDASTKLNEMRDAIEKTGLKMHDGVEREYSVWDSNVYLDKGWLFQDDPKKFIKNIFKISK